MDLDTPLLQKRSVTVAEDNYLYGSRRAFGHEMIEPDRIVTGLSQGRVVDTDLGVEPTREDVREEVLRFKRRGLCGRRIAEQYLVPYFIANSDYGDREIELLDDVLAEEYRNLNLCVDERSSECSRFRGGCKEYRSDSTE